MALSNEEKMFLPQLIARRKTVEQHTEDKELEEASTLKDIGIRKDDELDLTLVFFDKTSPEVGDIPLYFKELKRASFLEGRLEDEEEVKITCPRLMDKFCNWYKIAEDVDQNPNIDLPVFERS